MNAVCGHIVRSRRGLLAFGWHIVTVLTLIAFAAAVIFASKERNDAKNNYNYNNGYYQNNYQDEEEQIYELSLTSKAMAFAALWTGVLAVAMMVWGTTLLGVQSPTGTYYACCSGEVHRTTPLALGAFVGALVMFANLTLVCAVLFGEFQIRDYAREGEGREREQEQYQDKAVEKSSTVFSIMCLFLTALYALYAGLIYTFHESIMEENIEDEREEALRPSEINTRPDLHPSNAGGRNAFMGGTRFDVLSPKNAMA